MGLGGHVASTKQCGDSERKKISCSERTVPHVIRLKRCTFKQRTELSSISASKNPTATLLQAETVWHQVACELPHTVPDACSDWWPALQWGIRGLYPCCGRWSSNARKCYIMSLRSRSSHLYFPENHILKQVPQSRTLEFISPKICLGLHISTITKKANPMPERETPHLKHPK